ncbi:hypothetical protein [Clostridium sporogenes]|nr:hypothetical protein [Clostridium sporogenes]EDU37904.1 hypothetical protein CLOSPO_00719 [Clostridium sporogenes ATCC 15579]
MNPVNILKIIILILELIASGLDTEYAIGTVSSKYNISETLLRKIL